jgi:uncharacterized protein (UPF0548 family)
MALRARRPSDSDLADLLATCRSEPLTYSPVGTSLVTKTPAGLHRRHWTSQLQDDAFDRAVDALVSWEMHRKAGLVIVADDPMAVGTNVAMAAPLPFGYVDATCRIVAVVDEPNRQGFAYGTLRVHPEIGEEAFLVVRDTTTRFEITAVSRSCHPLARLIPPLAHRLQDRAAHKYLTAMSRLTNR